MSKYDETYNRSAKGRARNRRYNRSRKGHVRNHRYNVSAKGRQYNIEWNHTEKGRARIRRYELKPHRKDNKLWTMRSLRLKQKIQQSSLLRS